MSSFIQVQTTCDDRNTLEKIAESLVSRKLAACVQIIGPITSYFRWEGKVDYAQEFVCYIKTRAKYFDEVAKVTKELHSYDLPQIIALPIVAVTDEFSKWMTEETE